MFAKNAIVLLVASAFLSFPSVAKAEMTIQNNGTRMIVGGGRVDIQRDSQIAPRYPNPYWRNRVLPTYPVYPGTNSSRILRTKTWTRCNQGGYSQERYQSRSSGSGHVETYSSASTRMCR